MKKHESHQEQLDDLEGLATELETSPPTGSEPVEEPVATGDGDSPETYTESRFEPVEPDREDVEFLRHMIDSFIELPPFPGSEKLAERIAAVQKKYRGTPPKWVYEWYEELQLARIAGLTLFFAWRASKAKADDEEEKTGEAGQEVAVDAD